MMPSPEAWVLQIDPSVLKRIQRLPEADARRIATVVKLLPQNPFFGDIQKMKGEENVWRRRIGSYRLFFKLYPGKRLLLVFHLERRTSTTY